MTKFSQQATQILEEGGDTAVRLFALAKRAKAAGQYPVANAIMAILLLAMDEQEVAFGRRYEAFRAEYRSDSDFDYHDLVVLEYQGQSLTIPVPLLSEHEQSSGRHRRGAQIVRRPQGLGDHPHREIVVDISLDDRWAELFGLVERSIVVEAVQTYLDYEAMEDELLLLLGHPIPWPAEGVPDWHDDQVLMGPPPARLYVGREKWDEYEENEWVRTNRIRYFLHPDGSASGVWRIWDEEGEMVRLDHSSKEWIGSHTMVWEPGTWVVEGLHDDEFDDGGVGIRSAPGCAYIAQHEVPYWE